MKALKKKNLLVLSAVAILGLAACGGNNPDPTPAGPDIPKGTDTGVATDDAVEREDFTSLYDEVGADISIADVEEDAKGIAWIQLEGETEKRELGLDFLTMAMVYNVEVPEGSTKYHTTTDVYNQWWKLYIQRWNQLMPEVPLYSNILYDLFRPKLTGVETAAYWGIADAIVSAASTDGSVILGSSTDLSGRFRAPGWGVSSPAASDNDVAGLASGFSTVMTDKTGAYNWNLWDAEKQWGVLDEEPSLDGINEDGSLTITLKIHQGLKFSDGSDINAKNYIVGLLANSTPVGKQADGSGKAGLQLVGFNQFYTGAETGAKFAGVKLLDNYTFSVTYTPDNAGYYYKMVLAAFSPSPLQLYLGSATDAIQVDETTKECSLKANFFEKGEDGKYLRAAEIKDNMLNKVSYEQIPYSGPYKVVSFDKTNLQATLVKNEYYPGDAFRGKAPEVNPITNIAYIKTNEETQFSVYETGGVDVLTGIMDGSEIPTALALVEEGKATEVHYDRAAYGKLGFRCDFGPTMFQSVRQAIAYSIDRPQFAYTFTGGHGTVVHGPYFKLLNAYQAVEDEIILNQYVASPAAANRVLEADGWIYNKQGNLYKAGDGVRYRILKGYEKTLQNLQFKTVDGTYKTEFVNGNWIMPLAINYLGSTPNPVTELLLTSWVNKAAATTDIGMYIYSAKMDFISMLGEFYQYAGYGYDGTPKLNCGNWATSFSSTIYDQSYYMTIDPDLYDDYSNYYLRDEADFYNK